MASASMTFDIVPRRIYDEPELTQLRNADRRAYVSAKMWKRYNHIQEADLTEAATRLGKYLQENTPGTLDEQVDSQ